MADTRNSTNGDFTVTKTASPTTVPSGGGSVTYTYSVKNNTAGRLYYVGSRDDKCSPLRSASGLASETTSWYETLTYIPAGGTATWTCTSRITQDTTNTVWFDFANGYQKSYGLLDFLRLLPFATFTGTERGTAQATVTVQKASNALSCDAIYWSTFDPYETTTNWSNEWGSISFDGQTIAEKGSVSPSGYPYGATALAINPKDPTSIYFTARASRGNPSTSDGLFKASSTGSISTVSTSSSNALSTNRMGFDADGNLWSLASNGTLYKMPAGSTTWQSWGTINTSNESGGAADNPGSLKSGDLAFDGLGNMWIIGSDNVTSYLYTITAAELETTYPTAE